VIAIVFLFFSHLALGFSIKIDKNQNGKWVCSVIGDFF
jgi:hypothetical protein